VKLGIKGITNPYAVLSGYTWTVRTQRFQTGTIIEETSTFTSNLVTTKGTIKAATYASSWGVASTNVPKDSILFMDSSFTIENAVYDGNTAILVFTDDISNTFPVTGHSPATDCYMVDASQLSASGATTWTTCSASTSTVTVSNLKHGSSGTIYKFRVLAKLDTNSASTSQITSITTKSGANTIDYGANMAAFARAPATGTGAMTSNVITLGTDADVGIGDPTSGTEFVISAG